MNTSVRRATYQDVEAIVEVGHRTWRETTPAHVSTDYVEATLARWWTPAAIAWEVGGGRMLVALRDEQVVGVASDGHLNGDLVLFKLYVLPEHHGQGIGRQLVDRVIHDAKESGHQIIRASHLDGLAAAEGFYAAYGFRVTHHERVGDGMPDTVWLVREVWEPAP